MLYGFSGVILQGALVTLELAISSVVLAVIIGLIGAGGKLSQNRLSGLIFEGYTTLIRGVPDLVLMLLIFYGLQIALNTVTEAMGVGQIDIDPMVAGIITLGFILRFLFYRNVPWRVYGSAERTYRGGDGVRFYSWASVSADHVSGDDAVYALPGIGNNWQVILKSTALVSLLGLEDVVKPPNWQAKVPGNRSISPSSVA